MTSSSSSHDIPFSPQWDDPLPHALSRSYHYLTSPRRGQTKAALILMHGRGSDAEDIASAFLPTLQIRFGGKKVGVVGEDEKVDETGGKGEVAVVAIEAKDGAWYPQSHNATDAALTDDNEPYAFSSLETIRRTILALHHDVGLPLSSIVFAGFSQGAILGDTYLLAGLDQILTHGPEAAANEVPLPGHMLSLAGSLFKTPPHFPKRGYLNEAHRRESFTTPSPYHDRPTPRQPHQIRARLICGTADRFFTPAEIEEAAKVLGEKAKQVKEASKGEGTEVVLSVAFDEGKAHAVTDRMIAAVVESLEEILGRE